MFVDKRILNIKLRWINFTWFSCSQKYNITQYPNYDLYFAYMVLLDDDFGNTDEEKIEKWINTPYVDTRYLIIQMMVFIPYHETKIPETAIHFYINNNNDFDPISYIWGLYTKK